MQQQTKSLLLKPPNPGTGIRSKTTKQLWTICFGSATSIGALGFLRLDPLRADCAYQAKKPPPSRLIGMKDEAAGPEFPFPWKELLKLLLPEIWYLLGAVIVSIYSIVCKNVINTFRNIPVLLYKFFFTYFQTTEMNDIFFVI